MATPLLVAAFLSGCGSVETGNGADTTVTVKMALTGEELTPAGDVVVRDANGAQFTLTSARAVVERIRLDLPDGATCPADGTLGDLACDAGSNRVELDGPWIVDLIAGTWTPALAPFPVLSGSYRRVEVTFSDKHGDLVTSPDPLFDNALVVEGTFLDDDMPYRLSLDFTESARFESTAGISVNTAMGQLALVVDAATWLAGVPLAECATNGQFSVEQGVLILGDGGGACSDVENVVKDAIKASGELRDALP